MLKLEVGKSYKDGDDNFVQIIHQDYGAFVGLYSNKKDAAVFSSDGAWVIGLNEARNLIEEWKEPVVHEFWVHAHEHGIAYMNEETHKKAHYKESIQAIRIRVDLSKPIGQMVREIVEE